MILDAILYVCGAIFIFQQGYLSTEEAYKYASPIMLFWLKFSVGSLAAGAAGLKGFRSTSFAKSKGMLNPPPTGNTEFLTKPPTPEKS